MQPLDIGLRITAFVVGFLIVYATLASAVKTFVLPRSANVFLTRLVFTGMWTLFDLRLRKATTYEERDQVMAMYAPISLLVLPVVWLFSVMIGYMGMFWALGVEPLYEAFKLSGSSLLTLGFATTNDFPRTVFAFTEAILGLILIALLIAYLPTMYSTFTQREAAVSMLEVRAGSPPAAVTMIERYHRLRNLAELQEVWIEWERWFTLVEETHTSLAAINFFRSPQPEHSWITAAGAVLDTAALTVSTLDIPHEVQADLCIRAGYLCLRHICDFFRITYPADPRPDDPISISRQEFDEVYEGLKEQGVPVKPDCEQAWRDFAGWRVNYDAPLLELADFLMAPYAPWSSDRGLRRM
jgi:hypothetical protein